MLVHLLIQLVFSCASSARPHAQRPQRPPVGPAAPPRALPLHACSWVVCMQRNPDRWRRAVAGLCGQNGAEAGSSGRSGRSRQRIASSLGLLRRAAHGLVHGRKLPAVRSCSHEPALCADPRASQRVSREFGAVRGVAACAGGSAARAAGVGAAASSTRLRFAARSSMRWALSARSCALRMIRVVSSREACRRVQAAAKGLNSPRGAAGKDG